MTIFQTRRGWRGQGKQAWIGIPGTGIIVPSGPYFVSAAVNGSALALGMSEPLDSTNVPAPSTFSVLVNGVSRTVSSLSITLSTVNLVLSSAVTASDTVTIAYTDPTAVDDTNALQAVDGRDVASFGPTTTTNLTPDVTPIDQVFKTTAYSGNGAARTINNGLNFASDGGLVWTKDRSAGDHILQDSLRGVGSGKQIASNSANPTTNFSLDNISSFDSSGYSISSGSSSYLNTSGSSYVSWGFKRASKFFDIVTYTGTGSASTIAHSLGTAPGMILIKRLDAASNWAVYHRSIGAGNYLLLNATQAQAAGSGYFNSTDPTSSQFSLGINSTTNASGGTYVAYLFAHDPDPAGFIQCGGFTTAGDSSATVTLGWQPQFVLVKRTSTTGDWFMLDTSRGFGSGLDFYLNSNSINSESYYDFGAPTSTGIQFINPGAGTGTYAYMAIRAP